METLAVRVVCLFMDKEQSPAYEILKTMCAKYLHLLIVHEAILNIQNAGVLEYTSNRSVG